MTTPADRGASLEDGITEKVDVLVEAMGRAGVRHLFFASGSDILPFQEAAIKAASAGRATPRIVTVLHEIPGANAAMGAAMVSGGPSAIAVHVDSGVLNIGGGLHTADSGGYPILILAGSPPRGYPGTIRGARDHQIYWLQEYTDQRALAQPWVKWSLRLEQQDNPGLVISRALQVALSEPQGPAFLTVPREVAMAAASATRYPTVEQLGLPTRAAPDPAAIARLAAWILEAARPLIIAGRSGKDPSAVAALVRVAELVGIPVTDNAMRDRLNFPGRHPLYETGPSVSEADLVLVLDRRVPWVPAADDAVVDLATLPEDRSAIHMADPARSPSRDCRVVWMGHDPVVTEIPVLEMAAALRITTDPALGLSALADEISARLTPPQRARADERLAMARARKEHLRATSVAAAVGASTARPIDPRWVAHELGQLIGDEAILVDDSVSNAHVLRRHAPRDRPHSYFSSGSATGGWGSGAALGAKLAAPDRDVVLVSGDGFYAYGVPTAALWTAAQEGAPYLAVVWVNSRYSTGTLQLLDFYPDGHAARAGFPGGRFEPAPDFAAEARAAGAFGEQVTDPAEVRGALQRGLKATRDGKSAVVAIHVS